MELARSTLSLLFAITFAMGCGGKSAADDEAAKAAAAACDRSRKELDDARKGHASSVQTFADDFRSDTMNMAALAKAEGKTETIAAIEAVGAAADAAIKAASAASSDATVKDTVDKARALIAAREKFEGIRSKAYAASLDRVLALQTEMVRMSEQLKADDLAKRKADLKETQQKIAAAADNTEAAKAFAAARAEADKIESLGKSMATACAAPPP
jgi:hypothetical protein